MHTLMVSIEATIFIYTLLRHYAEYVMPPPDADNGFAYDYYAATLLFIQPLRHDIAADATCRRHTAITALR